MILKGRSKNGTRFYGIQFGKVDFFPEFGQVEGFFPGWDLGKKAAFGKGVCRGMRTGSQLKHILFLLYTIVFLL